MPFRRPVVSIILPFYNAERHIQESINSMLNQTFFNFELLLIDDGSTDASLKIVKRYKDKRIKIIKNKKNKGLIYCLNLAIKSSKGEFIARMDADDISANKRLEMQVAFLKKNKSIDILGTGVSLINKDGLCIKNKTYPNNDILIKWSLNIGSPLVHPSIMFRRSLFDKIGLYSKHSYLIEDYNLWLRACHFGVNFANLDTILLKLRKHNSSVTELKKNISKHLNSVINEAYRYINKIYESKIKLKKNTFKCLFTLGKIQKSEVNKAMVAIYDLFILYIHNNNVNFYSIWQIKKDVLIRTLKMFFRCFHEVNFLQFFICIFKVFFASK